MTMCNSRSSTRIELKNGRIIKVDKCIAKHINLYQTTNIETLGCCCGHGRYQTTIVAKLPNLDTPIELFSAIPIHRKTRFYRRNKTTGYYYIPEVEAAQDG